MTNKTTIRKKQTKLDMDEVGVDTLGGDLFLACFYQKLNSWPKQRGNSKPKITFNYYSFLESLQNAYYRAFQDGILALIGGLSEKDFSNIIEGFDISKSSYFPIENDLVDPNLMVLRGEKIPEEVIKSEKERIKCDDRLTSLLGVEILKRTPRHPELNSLNSQSTRIEYLKNNFIEYVQRWKMYKNLFSDSKYSDGSQSFEELFAERLLNC